MALHKIHGVTLVLHAVLLASACCICQDASFAKNVVFWLLVMVNVLCYLIVGVVDPGFVPLAGDDEKKVVVTHSSSFMAARNVELSGAGSDFDVGKVEATEAASRLPANDSKGDLENSYHGSNIELFDCEKCKQKVPGCKSFPVPLRAKHCKYCRRCVRTHDHHCPWIGNCVGEKNRVLFLWYTLLQGIEASWVLEQGVVYVALSENENWLPSILLSPCLLVVLIFALLLFSVFVNLVWGAALNVTTWECLMWHRITYLRELPSRGGSPFSSSLCYNFMVFFCSDRCAIFGRTLERLHETCGCWFRRECHGSGRMRPRGYVAWRPGEPYIPCILRNRCCRWFLPAEKMDKEESLSAPQR